MKKALLLIGTLCTFLLAGCGGGTPATPENARIPINFYGTIQETPIMKNAEKTVYAVTTASGKTYHVVDTSNVVTSRVLGAYAEIDGFIIDGSSRPIAVAPEVITHVSDAAPEIVPAPSPSATTESSATPIVTPEGVSTGKNKTIVPGDFTRFESKSFKFTFVYPKKWYFKRAPETKGELGGYRMSLDEDGKEIARIVIVAKDAISQEDGETANYPTVFTVPGDTAFYRVRNDKTYFKVYGDDTYASVLEDIAGLLEID